MEFNDKIFLCYTTYFVDWGNLGNFIQLWII